MGDFRLIDWAREQRTGKIGADNVLWRVAGLCNRTGRCTMTDAGLGKRFGLGQRTVTRYLAHLRHAEKIRIHFENGRRIITFVVQAVSQDGRSLEPKRRLGRRQIGRQNPIVRIQEKDLREYLRIASMENGEAKYRALAALRSGSQSNGESPSH